MMRKLGFTRFVDSASVNAPRPTTTDAAAKPACCKNLRLLNNLISCSILVNVPEKSVLYPVVVNLSFNEPDG